jgi:hypothetical protein
LGLSVTGFSDEPGNGALAPPGVASRYSTRNVAFIAGWNTQMYANSPFVSAVYVHDSSV